MSKSNEPVLWLLFSAGGMISAMVFPILLIITGVILPFELAGEVTFERIHNACLLYTSPSPRDRTRSRMPSSA